MSPAPKRGEWGTGDVGAPTGAVPINPSSYSHELYWVKLLEWFVEENLGEPSLMKELLLGVTPFWFLRRARPLPLSQ